MFAVMIPNMMTYVASSMSKHEHMFLLVNVAIARASSAALVKLTCFVGITRMHRVA